MAKDNSKTPEPAPKKVEKWVTLTCIDLVGIGRIAAGETVEGLSTEDVKVLKKLKAIKKPD